MEHANWGPEFRDDEIAALLSSRESEIASQGCVISKIENEDELCRTTAATIAEGLVVGWFQGRMEWGPRALGNRSILADPRRVEMRDILNSKIKRREMFRPFAPSILEEAAGDYFTQSYPSPFMLMAYSVRPEKRASDSGDDACRRDGAPADGECAAESVVLQADPRVRASDWSAGVAQYLVQRKRTGGLPSGRGARLLSQNQNGPVGDGAIHRSPDHENQLSSPLVALYVGCA